MRLLAYFVTTQYYTVMYLKLNALTDGIIYAYSHPVLAMSRRTKRASGADSMGNLASGGCCVCVLGYCYHSAGCHCLPHEERCEINANF